ncbi:MAG: NAD(P)/FAD-dependent oxidoreductase [Candidatus Omnitrophota bacterium]
MNDKYDVVIIGSGIGGLICACYLAKAKQSVLVIEQHNAPGGYCTSFSRGKYRFDVGVRYFAGIEKGTMGRILDELSIKKTLGFRQFDPTDKIIDPDGVTYLRANPDDTIIGLQKEFPCEKENIRKLFRFMMDPDFLNIYSKVKKMSFAEVINSHFSDERLRFIMNSLIFCNNGLAADEVSAVFAIIIFRNYLLDPGYYLAGGVQSFPDALVSMLRQYGGELKLSTKVTRIITKDSIVKGVECEDGSVFDSDTVVANVDATQVFTKLLDIKSREASVVNMLEPSNSTFIAYIGLSCNISGHLSDQCGILYFSSHNVKDLRIPKKDYGPENAFMNGIICEFPSLHDPASGASGNSSVTLAIQAPFKPGCEWEKMRKDFETRIIEKAEKEIFKFQFKKYIELALTAIPDTLLRYTSNRAGALFGWASLRNQVNMSILPPRTTIEGLYLAGHWCTIGSGHGGVTGVALSGRKTAEIIMKQKSKDWGYAILKP